MRRLLGALGAVSVSALLGVTGSPAWAKSVTARSGKAACKVALARGMDYAGTIVDMLKAQGVVLDATDSSYTNDEFEAAEADYNESVDTALEAQETFETKGRRCHRRRGPTPCRLSLDIIEHFANSGIDRRDATDQLIQAALDGDYDTADAIDNEEVQPLVEDMNADLDRLEAPKDDCEARV
jgi:hypothetical protein